jgi:hypothetical protein
MVALVWYVTSWHLNVELVHGEFLSVSQTFHCLNEALRGWYSRQSNDHKRNHTDFCTCCVSTVATTWSHPVQNTPHRLLYMLCVHSGHHMIPPQYTTHHTNFCTCWVSTVATLSYPVQNTPHRLLYMLCVQWPPHDPTTVYNTPHRQLTAREEFFTVTLTDSLHHCAPQILHRNKLYHQRELIILESATRNNLELYRPIDSLMTYFSWLYSRDSIAATSKGNLGIRNSHLMMGKVQRCTRYCYIAFHTSPTTISPDKIKDTEKIQKIFPENKCTCYARTPTHTHTHTHSMKPTSCSPD